MNLKLTDGHPFALNALAFNAFDHTVSVATLQTATGVAYETLTYSPRNTPGFDYDQFFTYAGASFGKVVLTFSFDASVSQVRSRLLAAGASDFTVELTSPRSLTPAEQANALAALNEIESFANIDFQQVSGAADINYFQDPRFGADGFARSFNTIDWSPGGSYALDDIVGMVVIGTANDPFYFRHELGHLLTLKHVGPFQFPTDAPLLPAQFLDSKYTIMFYDVTHADLSDPGERVNKHFQLFDVYALQQRFGANTDWRKGDDVYTAASFDGDRQVLWDAGGADTLDFSDQSVNQTINLNDGRFSTLGGFLPPADNLSIAFGAVIENAIGGSGADRLSGNKVGNLLSGGVGGDILEGGAGADSLDGGAGVDTASYADATSGVTIRLWNGTGANNVAAGDVLANIENVAGSGFNDNLIGADNTANRLEGASGNDYLAGLSGDDLLIGGLGADTIDGGAGVDAVFYGDATGSVTIRLWNGTGTNNVAAGDILTNIENVAGSNFGDNLVGADVVANWLGGGGGNDYLQGLSGNDTLVGGAGNDSLAGGSGADRHDFSAGSGADRVFSFIAGAGVWDTIRITGYGAALDSFAEILAVTTQVGADAVINLGGGNTITLVGVLKTSLVADDFMFI